jgi:hypothetical protein
MITSLHNLSFRRRVINYIQSANRQVSAAKICAVNLSTVNRCYSRYRLERDYAPERFIYIDESEIDMNICNLQG